MSASGISRYQIIMCFVSVYFEWLFLCLLCYIFFIHVCYTCLLCNILFSSIISITSKSCRQIFINSVQLYFVRQLWNLVAQENVMTQALVILIHFEGTSVASNKARIMNKSVTRHFLAYLERQKSMFLRRLLNNDWVDNFTLCEYPRRSSSG